MNRRLTPKDRNLIKGAIRRAFSRSELRIRVLNSYQVEHSDPKRPRVKKWAWCAVCGVVTPKYLLVLDHISPVVPTDNTFEDMSLDTVIDRTWCEEYNLQSICPICHNSKTKVEREERKRNKNERKRNQAS